MPAPRAGGSGSTQHTSSPNPSSTPNKPIDSIATDSTEEKKPMTWKRSLNNLYNRFIGHSDNEPSPTLEKSPANNLKEEVNKKHF